MEDDSDCSSLTDGYQVFEELFQQNKEPRLVIYKLELTHNELWFSGLISNYLSRPPLDCKHLVPVFQKCLDLEWASTIYANIVKFSVQIEKFCPHFADFNANTDIGKWQKPCMHLSYYMIIIKT